MSNKTSKFKKPPLSAAEKAKKESEFLDMPHLGEVGEIQPQPKPRPKGKEPVKRLNIRAPESMHNELSEIVNMTGISLNAVCLELLRPAVKKKLRELREEY